ncbi:unnamed protein product, partial [Adineta ricciae]
MVDNKSNTLNIMSNRLVYVNFKFRTLFILRQQIPCISSTSPFSTHPRNIDPGQQMKLLNDKKQFKQTIELFERETKKNKEQLSSFIIDQALKACVQVHDFRRGKDIHQLVQHRLSADSSLVKSLIHFYMQCHDMNTAESLFHMSTNKTVYICSVMMKGYIENGKPEKAIEVFKGIDKPDAVLITLLFKACAQVENPNEILIVLLFNACARLPSKQSLNLVKNTWEQSQVKSLHNDNVLTSVIDALMKCGDIKSAETAFDTSLNKSVYMYGAMMKGYIKNEMPEKAIDLFKQITRLDAVLVTLLFKACAQTPSKESLNFVKNIWKKYLNTSLLNPHAFSSLISALMKHSDVKSAENVFHQRSNKTLSMYGAMMKGYIDNEVPQKAIDLFRQVDNPNEILILLLFNACAQLTSEQSLNLVKNVWEQSQRRSLLSDNLLTSVIDALVKCGDVRSAEVVFDDSPNKSISMYGAMMNGYIKNDMSKKAIDLFQQIKDPNEVTITLMIQALMKCNNVKDAETFFHRSTNKFVRMYGAMMQGYINHEIPEKAVNLFNQVNEPDEILVTLLFKACAQMPSEQSLNLVKNVWEQYSTKLVRSENTLTSLINTLMKCGDVNHSEAVFTESRHKSISMYGAMMTGYIGNEMSEKAIDLFKQINDPNEVIVTLLFNACAQLPSQQSLGLLKTVWKKYQNTSLLDDHALTALIDAFMRFGDVNGAETIFDKLPHKVLPMYGAMMKGYLLNKTPNKTLDLYHQTKNMKETQSNFVIYLLAINASAQIAMASQCQAIVDDIPLQIISNSKISNALIDMWGKAGCVQKAEEVFANLSSIDQVGYASMIHVYGINGMGVKALQLFHQIPRSLLADYTYVCVLNACSHAGLVDQARSIFTSIESKTEKHYAATMDCLSRGSLFDEAQQLINQYELHHPPSPVMY